MIHVICDNARFHQAAQSKRVKDYLERWGERVRLHYLPTYAPETNPIERLWWHLHEEIGRSHSCRSRGVIAIHVRLAGEPKPI